MLQPKTKSKFQVGIPYFMATNNSSNRNEQEQEQKTTNEII